ncbi:MAG: D-alanyl-D-alanine carboxypeptidase/D-alanyl-D-alanine-endopeptidase [Myxococcota bacterium]
MRARSSTTLPILAAVALFVVPGTATPVDARDGDALASRLTSVVRDADLGDRIGVAVVDAGSGKNIFRHHAGLALNPASNMKLVTTAAALRNLGPDFRMLTGLYGEVEPDGRVGELVLRGFGDPSLRRSDLVELAEQLADRGVRRVDRLVVDGSYFDDRVLPPAFDQQPDETAAFRAPVGAVAVDHGAYLLRVMPGGAAGDAARVHLAGRGYFDLENDITTKDSGGPDVVAIQRDDGEGRMKLLLRGSVPTGVLGVGYRRRVENPLAHAAWVMVDALEQVGIRPPGTVDLGRGDQEAPLLVSHKSPPVAELVHDLGKHSDNFVAEMLLKVIGAERSRPGTSETGARVLQETLAAAGVDAGEASLVNGSGLFEGNRLAPGHLVALLAMMYRTPAVRPEYLSSLAVGGVDGTLARRLDDLPAARIVRAKTGTLADTVALSGYVLGREPGRALAFSFLANGVRGKLGEARRLADDLTRTLAEDLWAE